jgi:YidC/Oxa1 family membrane protein insertase
VKVPATQGIAHGAEARASAETLPATPTLPTPEGGVSAELPAVAPAPPTAAPTPVASSGTHVAANDVRVETDLFSITISRKGGYIHSLRLLSHPISVEDKEPFPLLEEGKEIYFVEQGGLLSEQGAITHHTEFTVETDRFNLAPSEDRIAVRLTHVGKGIKITKTYTFLRGKYIFNVDYAVENTGEHPWSGRLYEQLQRNSVKTSSSLVRTFTGAAYATKDVRYQKKEFADLKSEPLSLDVAGGWVAMVQHYFVVAVVPAAEQTFHFYSKGLDQDRYLLGLYGPDLEVAPGASLTTGIRMYAGPKLQHVLEEIAPGLDLTVDYSWLWMVAKTLFWTMEHIHELVGSWGLSIVLLTLTVKLILFPLSAKAFRSMARMRQLQPRLLAIKERHGEDKMKVNQETMELFRKEKVNPMNGCLPIVVQIPVFISLYWTLIESVELRQATFLWLKDLSAMDPYFVLPLLMGASMLVQQKMSPSTMDPLQQRIVNTMPVFFMVFCAFFSSGLVLYWVANNCLSILQQWAINRSIERSYGPQHPPTS